MGGLAVLVIIVAYIAIAFMVVRAIKSKGWKIAISLVFLLLPTADALVGRLFLKYVCATEGGLQVAKAVEGVEGFYDDTKRPLPEWIVKHGYQYVEGKDLDGELMRLERGPNDGVVERKAIRPRSKYRLERSSERSAGFTRSEYRVRETATNDVLARYVNISYAGGWVERLLGAFSDAGGSFAGACYVGAQRIWPDQIVKSALKPAQLSK